MKIAERYSAHLDQVEDEHGAGKAFARLFIHSFVVGVLVALVIPYIPLMRGAVVVIIAAVLGVIYFLRWAYS